MINTVHLTTISNQGGIFLDKYTLERDRRFSLMNTLMDHTLQLFYIVEEQLENLKGLFYQI